MNVILIRHYKVNIEKKSGLNSDEYNQYCEDYNIRDIIEQVPPELPQYRLYSSKMSRAKKTAELATGRIPEVLEGVYEPTFKSYKDTEKNLPFWFWELMARLQWFFNNKRQKEIKKDTYYRLSEAADKIINRNEDCIIVMHSFVMRIFSRILIKRGFKGKKIMMAKNGESYFYSNDK